MTDTHCPYCALQCGMTLLPDAHGRLVVGARDFPTNRGGLCRKGWTAAALLDAPDRLTTPLMRTSKDAPLEPVSWDRALDHAADTIARIQAAHGADAVGVFGGGGLTNETVYQLGKFARVALGTANIDYNGRFCMSSAAAAGLRAFGIDRGLPFPIADIAHARTVLLAGANPAETMPPLMQYFDAQREAGGALIVIDPRRTATAEAAQLHLQLTPGTDAALALGLLHIALRDGLADRDYIAARTTGFEEVRRIAAGYWPDRVERITGVAEPLLVAATRLLARAGGAMILTARGPEQQSHGVDNDLAYLNLALALGLPGRPHSGWGTLTGQGNGQGGREHGQKADQLPGYRKLTDPASRAAVAAIWGVAPASLPGPGLSAAEMLGQLGPGGSVRGLLVMASNIAVSAPDTGALHARLRALDLLVVADLFVSETAALADIVLPVAQWAEHDGTMTNLEGRVLRRRQARPPPAGVWTDIGILHALAARLGAGGRFGAEAPPQAVFEELARATAGAPADYAGISYARIDAEQGVFWPCPEPGHAGTRRLFADGFAHADGRARFTPVRAQEPAELLSDARPFWLTTGRVMAQYQSGTQTRRVADLAAAAPGAFVQIHPDAARTLGLAPDDMVRVTTRRGCATLRAQYSRAIRPDTVFVPFHWPGEGNANILTSNTTLDPVSRMPAFKLCAAHLAKVLPMAAVQTAATGAASRGSVISGRGCTDAGAAAELTFGD